MAPSGSGDNKKRGHDSRDDYRHPFIRDQSETIDEPHSGGNEEEAEIADKKVGDAVDPTYVEYTRTERCRQEHHADD